MPALSSTYLLVIFPASSILKTGLMVRSFSKTEVSTTKGSTENDVMEDASWTRITMVALQDANRSNRRIHLRRLHEVNVAIISFLRGRRQDFRHPTSFDMVVAHCRGRWVASRIELLMSGIFPTMGKLCFYARDLKILKCVPVRSHSHVWIFTTIIRLGNRMIQPHYYHSAGTIVVVRSFPIDEFSWGNEGENTHFYFPRTLKIRRHLLVHLVRSRFDNKFGESYVEGRDDMQEVACTKQRKGKATTRYIQAWFSSQIATQQNASYRTHILFVQ